MHPLHDYIAGQLETQLKKRRVVVFYDPRSEFLPFFDGELLASADDAGSLARVTISGSPTYVARYDGSYFALREAVEPIAGADEPEPLLVYVPGVTRDRRGSVLMELEKGGACYEPQLKQLARNVLRQRFTDGQIDDMLRPDSVRYEDVVSFLAQGGGEHASMLRTIFGGASSEKLLAQWLADDAQDGAIVEKDAADELFKLVESRLGLALAAEGTLAEARDRTLRYVLVGEFRSDLDGEPPLSIGMVPVPNGKEQVDRLRGLAELLRQSQPERYVDLADRVQAALTLDNASVDAARLGKIDTFRFEERALLAYAARLIVEKRYDDALNIISERKRSFWVDRSVARQAQWEACRGMAELGCEVERVRQEMSKTGAKPAQWVNAYAAESGWYRVDAMQRQLETWVAKMDDEPEAEQALAVVRREHEELLRRMADGFAKVLRENGWVVPDILPQTKIYPDVVKAMGGRVAYFFVDAMRFEMGVELARQLPGAEALTVRPGMAALPTITPVGMAGLLPGAAASFSVIESKGKLAATIEGTAMPTLIERMKLLKAKVPDAVDLTLGELLSATAAKLKSRIGDASLVVVRSQEIDFAGETDSDLLARQVMDSVIGNLARGIRKLAAAGVECFVISADHGHQFSIRKDDDMKTDAPTGDTLDLHRRCWIGRGGTTPQGSVRVSGAELGYDTDLDFVFPTGLGVFKAGGGLSFHHGGASLQEMVIPVISLRMPSRGVSQPSGKVAQLVGAPDKLTNRTVGVRVLAVADLFKNEPVAMRVILVSGSEQVGQTGMAQDAEFDRTSGVVRVAPGTTATVGLMLTREGCTTVRIVIQDPATDAVLAQSDEIPVQLGI